MHLSYSIGPRPPEQLAVMANQSGAFIRWLTVEGASGYTVYWCVLPERHQHTKCKVNYILLITIN